MKISKIEDLSVESLMYSLPKANVMGGQSVYIDLPSGDPASKKVIIQTPRCYLPFGLSEFTPNGGQPKYSLDLSLSGNTPAIQKFTEFLADLDEHNIAQGSAQSMVWFKKRLDKEVVGELYRRQLRKHPKHPPIMKVKVPTKNGEFAGDIFDASNRPISLNSITKGCHVQVIVECIGMYFVAKEFGITWRAIQLKVFPPERLVGYSFVDTDDDDEDAEPM